MSEFLLLVLGLGAVGAGVVIQRRQATVPPLAPAPAPATVRPPLAPLAPVSAIIPAPAPIIPQTGFSLGLAPGTDSSLPRGIRNNNPGNIRYKPSVQWVGQLGSDGEFVIFSHPVYGLRAMVRILKTYRERGVSRLGAIIAEWAPPKENNTEAYIQFVERRTGMSRSQVIGDEQIPRLMDAIIFKENSQNPYSRDQMIAGVFAANSEGSYA